jgi:RNA polymerase sigma factor FliA
LDSDEQALWLRWQQERTSATRNALIVRYSSWTRLVARDVYLRVPQMLDAWQDCVQNAMIGLIESIERFDPQRGVNFHTFARIRIRGAVFDGLRTLRASHVQLAADAKARADASRERLQSMDEGGEGDPLEDFVSKTIGLALGYLLDAQSMPGLVDATDAYAELEKAQLSASVSEALKRLPEREQTIIVMHYHHQLSFVEIAEHMGVTKGRISQLHKRSLDQLRGYLRGRVAIDC